MDSMAQNHGWKELLAFTTIEELLQCNHPVVQQAERMVVYAYGAPNVSNLHRLVAVVLALKWSEDRIASDDDAFVYRVVALVRHRFLLDVQALHAHEVDLMKRLRNRLDLF